jgi:hypothetical protein
MSLLTAAWTVGTLRHFARAGAASLTLFELVGWRGLVERDAGSPMAEFPSVPAMVFPVYDVFAAIGPPREWEWSEVETTPSGRVEALALTRDGTTRVLLANVTGSEQHIAVHGLEGRDLRVERVDADAVGAGLTQPRVARDHPASPAAGQVIQVLSAYEVAVITAVGSS